MRSRQRGYLVAGAISGLLLPVVLAVVLAAQRCRPDVALWLSYLPFIADCFDTARPEGLSDERIRQVIRVQTAQEAEKARQQLVAYIWGQSELPYNRLPTRVVEGFADDVLARFFNLSRIDVLVMDLEFGFVARAHYLVPTDANGRLAIYQEGHDGSFRDHARATLEALLADGFAVLALDMPMRGLNSWPTSIDVPEIGPVQFGSDSHWNLALLEGAGFAPVRLFLDPILRGLNYLEQHYGRRPTIMLGISGGGWTTTVYAALDVRIGRSYPVAGTLPFFLRQPHPGSGKFTSDGDYEQRVTELYRRASYLDLYVLGSIGHGRRQLQITNKYDPCCFFGDGAKLYAPAVAEAVAATGLGGDYRLAIDDTHARHAISPYALDLIMADATSP